MKKETNKVLKCKKRLIGKRKVEKIKENKNNHRRFFNKTDNIKQRYKPQTRMFMNSLDKLEQKMK